MDLREWALSGVCVSAISSASRMVFPVAIWDWISWLRFWAWAMFSARSSCRSLTATSASACVARRCTLTMDSFSRRSMASFTAFRFSPAWIRRWMGSSAFSFARLMMPNISGRAFLMAPRIRDRARFMSR